MTEMAIQMKAEFFSKSENAKAAEKSPEQGSSATPLSNWRSSRGWRSLPSIEKASERLEILMGIACVALVSYGAYAMSF